MPTDLLERPAPVRPGGDGPRDGERLPDGNGDGGGGLFADPQRFGLLAFLGTVTMMFVGFTSAYMVRKSSADWRALATPPLLWANTALLVASSATLELARRRQRGWDLAGLTRWLAATGALGALFVAGQFLVWHQLVAQGAYLAANPMNSFFYLLTGLHVVHLAGGLVWFGVVLARALRLAMTPGEDGLRLFATYWHFLGGLWVYLFFLLFVV